MEIHRYERFWIAASLVLIVLFIGTIAWGAVGEGVTMVSDEGGSIAVDDVSDHPDFGDLPQDAVRETGEDEYEVYVLARQFNFVPGTARPIEVPANSTVTFHVTTPDVTHGFEVVGTNVNTMIIPGQVTTFTVAFDEPAEYGLLCNEYCGSGHHLMEGKLHVVPEDEFSLGDEGDDGAAMDGGDDGAAMDGAGSGNVTDGGTTDGSGDDGTTNGTDGATNTTEGGDA